MSNKEKKRNFISLALVLILILTYGLIIYKNEYNTLYERDVSCLISYNNELCEYVSQKSDFRDEYKQMQSLYTYEILNISALALENMEAEALEKLEVEKTAEDFMVNSYSLDFNKEIFYKKSNEDLALTSAQIDILLEDGSYEFDDTCYIAMDTELGYLILSCPINMSKYNNIDFTYSCVDYYYLYDSDTGEIIETNINSTDKINNIHDLDEFITSYKNIEKRNNSLIDKVVVDGVEYITVTTSVDNGDKHISACSFFEMESTKISAFYEALSSFILMLVFTILIWILISAFKKLAINEKIPFNKLKIGNSWICDKFLFEKYINTTVIITLFTLFISLFIHTLTDVFYFNMASQQSLSSLNTSAENYEKNSDVVYNTAYASGIEIASNIGQSLEYEYSIGVNNFLKQLVSTIDVEEITVYDDSGTIEYSTTPYIGYKLTTDENDSRYGLWKIIKGDANDLSIYEEGNTYTDFAVRRTDKVGIVLVRIPTEGLSEILDKLDFTNLIKLQNYAYADRLYSTRSNPSTLYIYKNGSTLETKVNNTLPMVDEGSSFVGIRTIDNDRYLVNNYGGEEVVSSLAYPTKQIFIHAVGFLILNIITYLLISLVLIFGTGYYSPSNELVSVINENSSDKLMKKSKDILIYSIPSVAIIAAATLLIRIIISPYKTSIYSILSSWEKSISIISLSTVLFSLGITIGLFLFISAINNLLTKSLSPQGATICSMLCSIIKAIIIICFVIGALDQIGINTTAITAGLGLTGLAVGIGSKDIINDMIAGLLIIIEGQIRVGDYIKAGDFSGVVISIGIRTTKITSPGKEMIINNSNLKNVTNYSKGLSLVQITIPLSIDTDISIIPDLVKQSSDRINNATNGMILSELKLYSSEVNSVGFQCCFTTMCDSHNLIAVRTICFEELVKIFKENNIKLATGTNITLNAGKS